MFMAGKQCSLHKAGVVFCYVPIPNTDDVSCGMQQWLLTSSSLAAGRHAPQLCMANTSWTSQGGVVLLAAAGKPRVGLFLAEWKSLYDSCSGERGLFSRAAAQRQAARNGRRDATQQFGTNPCW